MHCADPVVSLYDPAAQTAHVPPSWPEYPVLHLQEVLTELTAGEAELVGQLDSVPDLQYVFSTHGIQIVPPWYHE